MILSLVEMSCLFLLQTECHDDQYWARVLTLWPDQLTMYSQSLHLKPHSVGFVSLCLSLQSLVSAIVVLFEEEACPFIYHCTPPRP